MIGDEQESRVAELLMRVLQAPAPFYRDRLAALGIGDNGRIAHEVWPRLPLTKRDDLLRDQLAHLPHGTRRFADATAPVRAGATGTGADLLVLTWTAADLARERAAGVRLFSRLGLTAGVPVANTLPGALATPGALLVGDVNEELGALDVPLGTVETEAAARQAWELFDRVRPSALILDPASATRLFAAVPQAERSWWRGIIWLRLDVSWAEPPRIPATAGFRGWQRVWFAVPEATCFVASSCDAGRFHVDDHLHAEVVDEATGQTVTNERGSLALTPFGVDGALLRYVAGARARRLSQACACGDTGVSIELL